MTSRRPAVTEPEEFGFMTRREMVAMVDMVELS